MTQEILKRIEYESIQFEDKHPFDAIHSAYFMGAISERNKVLDEAIENVTKLGENVDPIFQVAFYSIINELKSLKL